MQNLFSKIKNLFLNRNTVTILGVLAGVVVLWLAYSMTLDKAVKPVRVPVASKNLTAGTIITNDDIEFVEVNSDAMKKASVLTTSAQVVGKYVGNGTSVLKGAMFYSEQVVTKDKLIDRDLETIPENYKLYWLKVDNTTTYANSIYPGDKIDLWLRTRDEGKYVYEEFIRNIEVLSVKDSSGQNVFDVGSGRTPAVLVFAVPDELFSYLSKVGYLSGMQLFPVPINKKNSDRDEKTEITNNELKNLIDSQARVINPDTIVATDNNTNNE